MSDNIKDSEKKLQITIIMDSQLIIHSTNQTIYCCCFCWDAVVALAGSTSLQLWDVLSGVLIAKFDYGHQLAPISVYLIEKSRFLLQDKTGLILVIQHRTETENFKILGSYEIEPIGFTKICPWIFLYNPKGIPCKQTSDYFCTVFKNEQIQQRNILDGKVLKRFTSQDVKFVDVTAMIHCQIQSKNYFLVAEQGCTIKKVELIGVAELSTENVEKITLESDKEIKIILHLEPIEIYRVIAVLREDRLVVIDLNKMEVFANLQTLKMVRSLKVLNHPKLWVFSQKKAVGVISDNKIIMKQKIFTQLVIGIDSCQWGIIGASEQGKLFALPL